VSRSHATLWLLVVCTAAYLLTAPGRITYPDDEIVYETTESLWERGSFAIEGIPFQTGEPAGRPAGRTTGNPRRVSIWSSSTIPTPITRGTASPSA